MIECYFDDSGKESDPAARFVCIAGYIAHDHFWWEFLRQWNHLLLRHGITAVHMKELVQLRGEYEGRSWNRSIRNMVLSEFIEVIKNNKLIGFGAAVDAECWKDIDPDRRKKFGNAQEFCFQRVVRRIVDRMEKADLRDDIAIVFDRDMEFAGARLNLFKHISKGDPRAARMIASISFADSRRYPQLQAADILAWETRQELINRVERRPSTARFSELLAERPFTEIDYEGEYWDQRMMEENFAAVERELAEARTKAVSSRRARRKQSS